MTSFRLSFHNFQQKIIGKSMQTKIRIEKYNLLNYNFIRAYVITMRPYLLFVSGITGIVGLAYAPPLNLISTASIIAASFLSYGFGQALTDCFQTDTDSISSPYRPLTQGVVSKNHFLIVSIAGLIFCIVVFVLHNPINLILGITAGLGLATYSNFKRKFWAGPFYNAWIVAVLCIMSFLSGSSINNFRIESNFVLVVLCVFFGYANFVLSGYFKDVTADRATNYNTLPVVYGRKIAAYICDVFAFLTVLFGSIVFVFKLNEIGFDISLIQSALFLSASIIVLTAAQILLHKVRTDDQAYSAISLVVHGYILQLSGLAVLQRTDWMIFLILFYAGFNMVMNFRPERSQI